MAEESAKGVTARVVAINTLWGALGRLVGGLLAIWALAVISRTLGPNQYGDYATVLAFFYVFSAVADLGIYQILVRDIGSPEQNEEELVGTALIARSAAVLLSLVVGVAVFLVIPKYQGLVALAPIAAVAYLPLSIGQIFMAVFQKHLRVRSVAIIEVIARAVQVGGIVWLVGNGEISPTAFLWVLLASTIVQTTLLVVHARKLVRFHVRTTRQRIKNLLQNSLPIGISLVFTLIYFRLDTVLLSLLQTSEAVGIYNLAYKVLEQIIFLPAMFLGVLTPILTKALLEDKERFRKITQGATRAMFMAVVPILIGGLFLRENIIALLGGEAYQASAQVLVPLLIAVALIFAGTLSGALVVITNNQKRAIKVYGAAMIGSVVLNLLLIPRFSYMGAAWTTVIVEVAVVLGLLTLLRGSGVSFRVVQPMRIIFAGALMAVPLLFAPALTEAVGSIISLVVYLVLSPLVYAAALLATNAVTWSHIQKIARQ